MHFGSFENLGFIFFFAQEWISERLLVIRGVEDGWQLAEVLGHDIASTGANWRQEVALRGGRSLVLFTHFLLQLLDKLLHNDFILPTVLSA